MCGHAIVAPFMHGASLPLACELCGRTVVVAHAQAWGVVVAHTGVLGHFVVIAQWERVWPGCCSCGL